MILFARSALNLECCKRLSEYWSRMARLGDGDVESYQVIARASFHSPRIFQGLFVVGKKRIC